MPAATGAEVLDAFLADERVAPLPSRALEPRVSGGPQTGADVLDAFLGAEEQESSPTWQDVIPGFPLGATPAHRVRSPVVPPMAATSTAPALEEAAAASSHGAPVFGPSRPGFLGALQNAGPAAVGGLANLAKGPISLLHGVTSSPEDRAEEIQAKRDTGLSSSILQRTLDAINERQAPGAPLGPSREAQAPESLQRMVDQAIRSGIPSIGMAVLGAGVGAKATPPGAPMLKRILRRAAGAGLAGGTALGIQSYDEKLQEYIGKGMNANQARVLAGLMGASEGGSEGLSDMVAFGAFNGLVSKEAVKQLRLWKALPAPVRAGVFAKMGPKFADWFARNLAPDVLKTIGAETGTEVLNAWAQNKLEDLFAVPGRQPQSLTETAGTAGLMSIPFAALGLHLGRKTQQQARTILADPKAAPADREAVVHRVANELTASGLPAEAAVFRTDMLNRIADGQAIDLEARQPDETTQALGNITNPTDLAERTERYRRNAEQMRAAAPAPLPAAKPPKGETAEDFLAWLRPTLSRFKAAPESVRLVPVTDLPPEQRAHQRASAQRGVRTVYFDADAPGELPAINAGAELVFIPRRLGPADAVVKPKHELGHALDARPELASLTAATRQAIPRVMSDAQLAAWQHQHGLDRANAGMDPTASVEQLADELTQDERAPIYAAIDANPADAEASLKQLIDRIATKEPGRFQRLKDTLRSVLPGRTGVKVPEARGTVEQWTAVTQAALAELRAATSIPQVRERTRLLDILGQVERRLPAPASPAAERTKVRDVTIGSSGSAARAAGKAKLFAQGRSAPGAPAEFRVGEILRHNLDGQEYRVVAQDSPGVVQVLPTAAPKGTLPVRVPVENLTRAPAPAAPAAPAPARQPDALRQELEERASGLGVANPRIFSDQELQEEIVHRIQARPAEERRAPGYRHIGQKTTPAPTPRGGAIAQPGPTSAAGPEGEKGEDRFSLPRVGGRFSEGRPEMDDSGITPTLADVAGTVGQIYSAAGQTFHSWPARLVAADGTDVLLHNPQRGSLTERVKHLILDDDTERVHAEKAAWLPMIPTTLEGATTRIVDGQKRIFARRYGKDVHIVIVRPDQGARVVEGQPFRGALVTQFVDHVGSKRAGMTVDWSQEETTGKGSGLSPGTPRPTPTGSTLPDARQPEFQNEGSAGEAGRQGGEGKYSLPEMLSPEQRAQNLSALRRGVGPAWRQSWEHAAFLTPDGTLLGEDNEEIHPNGPLGSNHYLLLQLSGLVDESISSESQAVASSLWRTGAARVAVNDLRDIGFADLLAATWAVPLTERQMAAILREARNRQEIRIEIVDSRGESLGHAVIGAGEGPSALGREMRRLNSELVAADKFSLPSDRDRIESVNRQNGPGDVPAEKRPKNTPEGSVEVPPDVLSDSEFHGAAGVSKEEFLQSGGTIRWVDDDHASIGKDTKDVRIPISFKDDPATLRESLIHELTHFEQITQGRSPKSTYVDPKESIHAFMEYLSDPSEVEARYRAAGKSKGEYDDFMRALNWAKSDEAGQIGEPEIGEMRVEKIKRWEIPPSYVQQELKQVARYARERGMSEATATAAARKISRLVGGSQALVKADSFAQEFKALAPRFSSEAEAEAAPYDPVADLSMGISNKWQSRRLGYGDRRLRPDEIRYVARDVLRVEVHDKRPGKFINPILIESALRKVGVHAFADGPNELKIDLTPKNVEAMRSLGGKFANILGRKKIQGAPEEPSPAGIPPGDARFSLPSALPEAWRERGLNLQMAAEHAIKYWPAGGRPAEDTLGTIPEGRAYLQRVERAWWETRRRTAAWSRGLNAARRGLKKSDKRYLRDHFLRDYERSGVGQAWPSPAVEQFARAWHDAAETISTEVGGIIETFRGRDSATYIPHRLTEQGRATLQKKNGPEWDALVAAAKIAGIDIHVLETLRQDPLRQAKYGSIDYARVANLPWEVTTATGKIVKILETDPEILFSHVRSAARRISTVEQFGSDEASSAYLDQVANGLVYSGALDSESTREAIARIWNRLEGKDAMVGREVFGKMHDTWQAVDSVVAALNLSGAVIGNVIGGHLPESVRMGFGRTAKAFWEAYTTSLANPGLDDLHALTDLEGDLLHELAATETLEGKVAKVAGQVLRRTGFVGANRRINLAVARAMQKQNLQLMLDSIREGRDSTWQRRWGRDAGAARRYLAEELRFSEDDVQRMVLQGPTEKDMARAIGKELELVNAMNESPGSRPQYVAHPVWRMGFAYSTYVRKFYDTTKFAAREARAGNLRPLVTLLVAGTVTAEIMAAVKNIFKDREKEDEGFFDRLMGDMAETGALGLASSWKWGITQMAERPSAPKTAREFWDMFAPPHVEALAYLVGGLLESGATASIKPLWKAAARIGPGVDIIDKQLTSRRLFGRHAKTITTPDGGEIETTYGERDDAERLVGKVYLADRRLKDGTERAALDPIPTKHKENTSRRILRRLRQTKSDEEIVGLVRAAKDHWEGAEE